MELRETLELEEAESLRGITQNKDFIHSYDVENRLTKTKYSRSDHGLKKHLMM